LETPPWEKKIGGIGTKHLEIGNGFFWKPVNLHWSSWGGKEGVHQRSQEDGFGRWEFLSTRLPTEESYPKTGSPRVHCGRQGKN